MGEKRVARLMALAGLEGAHQRRKRGCTVRAPVSSRPRLGRPGFPAGSAQPRLVRGHQTDPDRRGVAVPRRGAGSVQPPDRRLEHGLATCAKSSSSTRSRWPWGLASPTPGSIHHSDHGGQFIGLMFGQTCHDAGIAQSMGAVGTCFDNAVAETFFATLTKEMLLPTRRPRAGRPALSCARRSSVRRGVLQPEQAAQHARDALPRRVRRGSRRRRSRRPRARPHTRARARKNC